MPVSTLKRPTYARIDLDALAFNYHSVRNFVGTAIEFMAVVKADAYGHGAVQCARRLEAEGVDWFGIAIPEEGVELRKAGITKPILCLGGCWPGQERIVFDHLLTPVIFSLDAAERLNTAAVKRRTVADVHIKVDTGMGRLGIRSDEFEAFVERLQDFSNLGVEGLMTHFAVADELDQAEFTNEQIEKFQRCAGLLKMKGFAPRYLDMANSPGAVVHPRSRSNLVRIGGLLYGLGRDVVPADVQQPGLRPVMSLYSKISFLKRVPAGETLGYGRTFTTERESLIATVPVGYHDGYPRLLSNRGKVIVNDVLVPVAGRISMDWTIIDVTDVFDVKIGDEVILIGASDELSVAAEDIAQLTDTISYEVTCGISSRVPRVY